MIEQHCESWNPKNAEELILPVRHFYYYNMNDVTIDKIEHNVVKNVKGNFMKIMYVKKLYLNFICENCV